MWSQKVHRIANFFSLLLILLVIIGMIGFLLDSGIVGKLLALVVALVFAKIIIFYLLQKLKVILKPKKVKQKTTIKSKVETNLDEQQGYIIDLKLQANQLFKTAIQSKKLNRDEITNIKDYLKNNVNDPTLVNKKYSNEAHCIYSYLKSEYINENTLNCVIKNIFIFANKKTA